MKSLQESREIIDNIDSKLTELFEERMNTVIEVAEFKKKNNLDVTDPSREKLVMEKNIAKLKNQLYAPYYEAFMQSMFDISKSYQKKILNNTLVSFQGTVGAFSNIAAKNIFPNATFKNYPTFEDVFQSVLKGETDYGVIPFENSFTGEIGDVIDLLFKYNLYFNQIYDLKVNQNLIGIKGAKISDIKDVYSHPQAIYQSNIYLKNRNFNVHEFANTALAAEYVRNENDISKAAIASIEVAQLNDLEVIAKDINTSSSNTTRFIVLSKNLSKTGNRFSIFFTLSNKVGSLANIINIIASNNFNMAKIQSRAIKDIPWEYYFHIEIEGSIDSTNSEVLISQLKSNTTELKILGSYTK